MGKREWPAHWADTLREATTRSKAHLLLNLVPCYNDSLTLS